MREKIEKEDYAREAIAKVCGEKYQPLDVHAYFKQYEQLSRQRRKILEQLRVSVDPRGWYTTYRMSPKKEEQIREAAKETAQKLITHYKT